MSIHFYQELQAPEPAWLDQHVLILPSLAASPRAPAFAAPRQVISAARLGNIAPYFYQTRDFDVMSGAHSLIRVMLKPTIPKVKVVLEALKQSNHVLSTAAAPSDPKQRQGGKQAAPPSRTEPATPTPNPRPTGGSSAHADDTDSLPVEAIKGMGNKAFEDGDFRKAVRLYTKAVERDPSNHVLYSNRSASYLQGSKQMGIDTRTMALRDADKAIEVRPDWFKGYSRRGDALFKLERYAEAVSAYEKALVLEPDNANLRHSLTEARNAAGGIDPSARRTAWSTAPMKLEEVDVAGAQRRKSAHELLSEMSTGEKIRTHIELLKLLALSLDTYDEKVLSKNGDSGVDLSFVLIPTSELPLDAQFIPLPRVCAPDSAILLRKIKPGGIHVATSALPLDVCRQLQVPSLVGTIREVPKAVVQLREAPVAERRVNALLRRPVFRRCLARLLLSQPVTSDALQDGSRGRGGRRSDDLSTDELFKVVVRFVKAISTTIVDSRDAQRTDISAAKESPLSSLDTGKRIIYVCASMQGATLAVPCQYLIATEINKLLGSRMMDLAPLACLLEQSMQLDEVPEDELMAALDVFGCPDIGNAHRQRKPQPGDAVREEALLHRGQCLWNSDGSVVPESLMRCCVAVDEGPCGLFVWVRGEDVLKKDLLPRHTCISVTSLLYLCS